MNFKKIYLILITLVFSLSLFSQQILVSVKNYTPDGKYNCEGHIINSVTLATQHFQFTVAPGPSSGGMVTLPVSNSDWELLDFRVSHANNTNPTAIFVGGNLFNNNTGEIVYRPSAGNNVVWYTTHDFFGNTKHYPYIIKI